jgi:LacI family transcriptional regulator
VGRHRTPRRWEALQQELADWLIGLPKPVGLMACNDARARYVLEACRLAGLKVPDDVAVIGVDNDEMICELTDPPLSSVDQAARRVGYEAARLLAGGLTGGRKPPPLRTVVPPVGVVTRASTDTMATSDETVVQVLRSLRADPRQKPDVEALAGQACISRSTLEKRFRGVVGRSIHQEHIRLKLAVVRQMIADTGLPLKTVASRCGFSSVQYMTSFLSRHLGATPARLRQEERARE